MSPMEKSDLPIVARKRANKAASAAAEPVERRGGAKENADLQSTVRTQSREAVSQAQAHIREAVLIRLLHSSLRSHAELPQDMRIAALRAQLFPARRRASLIGFNADGKITEISLMSMAGD